MLDDLERRQESRCPFYKTFFLCQRQRHKLGRVFVLGKIFEKAVIVRHLWVGSLYKNIKLA
jgi:hypothetical protein